MDEKTVEQSMQLILHSGTGRSMVIEAVRDMANLMVEMYEALHKEQ